MKTLEATDDLLLDAWPSGGKGDEALVVLRSLAAEKGGEPQRVIIYADEIRPLVAALVEAAVWLASQGRGS